MVGTDIEDGWHHLGTLTQLLINQGVTALFSSSSISHRHPHLLSVHPWRCHVPPRSPPAAATWTCPSSRATPEHDALEPLVFTADGRLMVLLEPRVRRAPPCQPEQPRPHWHHLNTVAEPSRSQLGAVEPGQPWPSHGYIRPATVTPRWPELRPSHRYAMLYFILALASLTHVRPAALHYADSAAPSLILAPSLRPC